ncbi:MAG TPA: alpha/beta fold hydrolase [Amycolatopsis sp.]|jgi:pimeloyl-ACP methyl ester carboxylesterase|nr:alpha/beta fold hydrolase [Amycolatopsis sp.]
MIDLPPHPFPGHDGIELTYRELGTGRALVLLHGFFSTAIENWVRCGHAEQLAARGFRVIMPDLRGHGDSAKPQDASAYPADVLADDGFALIEHLGLTDYDLGGYSLGGRMVVRMLVRGASPRRAVVAAQGFDEVVRPAGRTRAFFRHFLTNLGKFKPGSPEQRAEDFLKAFRGDPTALLHVLDTIVTTPEEALSRIETPTLMLVGSEDSRRASAEALAAAFPHSHYVLMPGDHTTAFTEPDRLGIAIAGFLAGDL